MYLFYCFVLKVPVEQILLHARIIMTSFLHLVNWNDLDEFIFKA